MVTPEDPIVVQKLGRFSKRSGIEAATHIAPYLESAYQAGVLKNVYVLGDSGKAHFMRRRKFANGLIALGKLLQDRAPGMARKRMEDLVELF